MNSITLTADVLYRSIATEPFQCENTHVLVACFPKSGSTWLSKTLSALPGFHRVNLVPVYGGREQELAFERLLLFHTLNYVAQHHCRYSSATESCLKTFSIRPVILIRNVFDCIISLRDHLETIDRDPEHRPAMAYVPDEYYQWSESEQFDFVIDMMAPWYFNFFVGWQDYRDGIWVTYEELLQDPLATVRRITDELELFLDDAVIKRALVSVSKVETRKNVAKVGRGNALSARQTDRIRQFASYYPGHDLSPIGL